ncbi:GIY-YIG nuclease family protein [Roseibium salinum]|uniref:GIY-YIG nuclease family protein n=1 Tax=Roseibium salinum TaxID=1604349 RepID=A0ABT3R7S1_9HYPH|nr:GIY-YIG nuclease family protein [Roseibium sp. DSM 29163]MCX2725048.1 GIY-YIG nuclease family protein [Roseibium sp. DSM 29163]
MGATVYILRCSNGRYYTGIPRKDLETRVSAHQQGILGGYTARYRPVTLVFDCHFDRITDAIACERQIKGWRREKKEALIRGDFEMLPALSGRGTKASK